MTTRSDNLVVFQGRACCGEAGAPLIVHPAAGEASEGLELSGGLAPAVATALRLATSPVSIAHLASSLVDATGLDGKVAQMLVDDLVDNAILRKVVAALERIELVGDGDLVAAIKSHIRNATMPSDIAPTTVVLLGTLGAEPWYVQLEQAQILEGNVLSCSIEPDGAWVGPRLGVRGEPCPGCLAARRIAVNPAATQPANFIVHDNRLIGTLAQHLLLWIEAASAETVATHQILRVTSNSVTRRTLLPQPGCRHCLREKAPTSSLDDSKLTTEEAFRTKWATNGFLEPTPEQRAVFTDPELGPLDNREYQAPGLFRDLPMVLGSIRMLQPAGNQLARREMFSVTFGSGMTESRRQLIAYAEGIERYAGSMELPDITSRSFDEVRAFAAPPQTMTQYAPTQYIEAGGDMQRYAGQLIDWSWAYDWTSDEGKLVIYDAMCMNRQTATEGFRVFDEPYSSGFAAHRSLPLALERILFESIERDAYMLAWYLQLPLPELRVPETHGHDLEDMRKYLKDGGVELRFFDLRVDFDVPCVLVMARAEKDFGPWLKGGHILSACAGRTWTDALGHGVQEILGHYSVFAILSPEAEKWTTPPEGESRSWWPRLADYMVARADNPFGFLGGDNPVHLELADEVPVSVEELRTQFQARNLTVFVRELGQSDVRSSGLVAVRAFIPGMVRLSPSRETVNFGEPRIDRVRTKWNALGPFNPLAHPLA